MVAALLIVGLAGWSSVSSPSSATVRAALLRKSDLPAGWLSSPATGGSGNNAGTAQLSACLGASDSSLNSPQVSAPNFVLKVGTGAREISSGISVGRQAAEEEKEFAALNQPGAASCISLALKPVLDQEASKSPGATIGKVAARRLNVPDYLDRTVGFRVSVKISVSGLTAKKTVSLVFDVVVSQRGRYTAQFDFIGIDTIVPTSVEDQAVKAVTSRMSSFPTN